MLRSSLPVCGGHPLGSIAAIDFPDQDFVVICKATNFMNIIIHLVVVGYTTHMW
jgi:hypothetical protein